MQKETRQFGLFGLFILTTAAAATFAIIRLPLPFIMKIVIVQTIAVCFFGWAVRNRKYPDPRLQGKPSSRQVLLALMPGLAGGVAFFVFSLLLYLKSIAP